MSPKISFFTRHVKKIVLLFGILFIARTCVIGINYFHGDLKKTEIREIVKQIPIDRGGNICMQYTISTEICVGI